MSEVDETIARASQLIDRTRERRIDARGRKMRAADLRGRITRIAVADIAILVAAMVLGWFIPLGMGGAMLVMAALIAATAFFAIFPLVRDFPVEKLAEVPLKALPRQTEQWLERQRPALPAPALNLVDSIGVKLEALSPQLATLNEAEPAAAEVRKLVGEQLPELVKGYSRVPETLRRTPRNGRTPDEQLVDGLKLIDEEIGQMSAQLAQGDLDLLATRGRFLQIRYREDEIGG